MQVMQISPSPKARGEANQDPHVGKHWFLQGQYQTPPLADIGTCNSRPHLNHFRLAEERPQEQHNHPMEDKWQSPLPCHLIGCTLPLYLPLPWCSARDTSVRHLGTQSTFTCNQQNHQVSLMRWHCHHWQGQTTYPPPQSWHPLNTCRRCNGYVSWWGPSVCNHVDRTLVKHRLHELHLETNRRIYLQRVNFHAHYATLLTCPERITRPEKKGIWRLGQHEACSKDGIGIKLGWPGLGKGQTFY